jgi:diaminopimelate decarboxylase/aspartate kinase
VTQLKEKSGIKYVGIDCGMNSLIRPALYDAYHNIVNLSYPYRQHDANTGDNGINETESVSIVGPICESADVFGINRQISICKENDVLLIADCGAYGRCMASEYNMKPIGEEVLF